MPEPLDPVDSKEGLGHRPDGFRLWTWLVICDDGDCFLSILELINAYFHVKAQSYQCMRILSLSAKQAPTQTKSTTSTLLWCLEDKAC